MKKNIVLLLLIVMGLTGCGMGATETMSCTYENTTNNLSSRTVYSIDYQKNEVKKVRVSYKYHLDEINDTPDENIDGVGTGTDGTTNDTQIDEDGIIDGAIGSAIDSIVNSVTTTILDISGLQNRHMQVQNTYGNLNGFSVQNTMDTDNNNYEVNYIIDFDQITDSDLANLNLSRDVDAMRSNYLNQGFTCQ